MERSQEEQEIVRYFLGDVTDEERDRIGEKTIVDLEYAEFAEGVAFDLMDSYARKTLSAEERRRFEQFFLVSQERREQVLAMSALASVSRRARTSRAEPGDLIRVLVGEMVWRRRLRSAARHSGRRPGARRPSGLDHQRVVAAATGSGGGDGIAHAADSRFRSRVAARRFKIGKFRARPRTPRSTSLSRRWAQRIGLSFSKTVVRSGGRRGVVLQVSTERP